jgi:hypothetical protein
MDNEPKNESKQGGDVESARRRLIKGAFAAPAVLALHSGSALANTSSAECAINQIDNPVSPSLTNATDNYVRVRLWTLRKNTGNTQIRYFVRGSDLSALGAYVVNEYLPTGSWRQFDPAAPATQFTSISSTPVWSSSIQGILAQDGPYVAVRFEADSMNAYVVGVVGPDTRGSAVTGSCWGSFIVA